VTTTTLALPAGFAQISPSAVATVVPTPSLGVIVVVKNPSQSALQVKLVTQLVTSPRGIAPTQQSTATADVAAGGSAYVTMPSLIESPKAPGFDLVVQASDPGVSPVSTTLQLTVLRASP